MRNIKKIVSFSLGILLISGLSFAQKEAKYEVTVENLTSNQPFTPPLAVTHRKALQVFEVGEAASFMVKEIAENGNLGPLLEALDGQKHAYDFEVALGDPPPLFGGAERTFEITAAKGANYLSLISMLICTNDGFTGLNSLRLPKKVGDSIVVETDAYDAGTEINTEAFENLVPPCAQITLGEDKGGTGESQEDLAEGGVIHHHEGITGIAGDQGLSVEIHNWENPVARITVTRTE